MEPWLQLQLPMQMETSSSRTSFSNDQRDPHILFHTNNPGFIDVSDSDVSDNDRTDLGTTLNDIVVDVSEEDYADAEFVDELEATGTTPGDGTTDPPSRSPTALTRPVSPVSCTADQQLFIDFDTLPDGTPLSVNEFIAWKDAYCRK